MAREPTSRNAQLVADLKKEVASAMSADASLTPHAAMVKITKEMLLNNPFVTPSGCPVNAIPPEILAHIFLVGVEMEEEEDGGDEDEDEVDFDVADEWSDEEEVDPDELDAMVMARLKSKGKVVQGADGVMDVDGEDEDSEEEDEDEDEEGELLPFQVLVSHVCRHWRQVAIETPALWSKLTFEEGAPFEKSKIWIQRAKSGPLDISIDCTTPIDDDEADVDDDDDDEDDEGVTVNEYSSNGPDSIEHVALETHGHHCAIEHMDRPPHSLLDLKNILDMIIPLVAQWRFFEVTTNVYDYMHAITSRLSECPSAPLLETLALYHYDDDDEVEVTPVEFKEPFLIFNGNAPNLHHATLCGVHLEWDRSLTLLSNLRHLDLSYHAEDVRPSFATFAQLIASSPNLRRLELLLSGPREDGDWGTDIIEIPSLKDLSLCYHKSSYAIALLKKLSVPNVHSLVLDFDSEDYTEFVKELTVPMPKTNKSILAGLEHMKISGLPCNRASVELMLGQLVGVKSFELACPGDEEREIFKQLFPVKVTTGGSTTPKQKIYCPNLQNIKTKDISGSDLRAFVEARSAAGVPIKRLAISDMDDVEERDERWLRAHVEEFDYYEASDSEEEIEVDDEEVNNLALHVWNDHDSMDDA